MRSYLETDGMCSQWKVHIMEHTELKVDPSRIVYRHTLLTEKPRQILYSFIYGKLQSGLGSPIE